MKGKEGYARARYPQPRIDAQEMETKPTKTKESAPNTKPQKSLTGDMKGAKKEDVNSGCPKEIAVRGLFPTGRAKTHL